MPFTRRILATTFVLTAALVTASAAMAQSAPPQTNTDNGPLVLTPVRSAIVFAPDVKVTTVNDKTAILTGGYVGKLTEKIVFVGAGAYWLVDPLDDAHLFYGGLMVAGRVLGTDRVNLGVRGLVGFGQGTVYETGTFIDGHSFHGGHPGGTVRVGFTQAFLVAEPEIRFSYEIVDGVSLNLGAGYRVTTADSTIDDRLHGATASIGVQFELH